MKLQLNKELCYGDYFVLDKSFRLELDVRNPNFLLDGGRIYIPFDTRWHQHLIDTSSLDVCAEQSAEDLLFLEKWANELNSHSAILFLDSVSCPNHSWSRDERYYFFDDESFKKAYYCADVKSRGLRNILTEFMDRAVDDYKGDVFDLENGLYGRVNLVDRRYQRGWVFGTVEEAVDSWPKYLK